MAMKIEVDIKTDLPAILGDGWRRPRRIDG
jgi:hypothetical protein